MKHVGSEKGPTKAVGDAHYRVQGVDEAPGFGGQVGCVRDRREEEGERENCDPRVEPASEKNDQESDEGDEEVHECCHDGCDREGEVGKVDPLEKALVLDETCGAPAERVYEIGPGHERGQSEWRIRRSSCGDLRESVEEWGEDHHREVQPNGVSEVAAYTPQQRLNFFPLPQLHGSLRPRFGAALTGAGTTRSPST